jgi:hypothetical protein
VYLSFRCCFLLLLQIGVREVIQGWDLGILGTEVSAQLLQGTGATWLAGSQPCSVLGVFILVNSMVLAWWPFVTHHHSCCDSCMLLFAAHS